MNIRHHPFGPRWISRDGAADILQQLLPRRHLLWKSSGARRDDAQCSWSGFKPQIREFCEAAIWLVRMRSCPEEAQAKLIHRGRAKRFVVVYDDLLCTGFRDAGKAWHAGVQGIEVIRVVEVIIKRPIAGHLVIEVYPLSVLVIPNPVPLVGVREISIPIA